MVNNTNFGLVNQIPLELFKRSSLAGTAPAIAATAEAVYGAAAAHGALYIYNNSENIAVIPKQGITVAANQRTELVVFERYTGATLNPAAISLYQRFDALATGIINIPRIVLKPGERLQVWAFNRAPAAASNISFSLTYYEIEARIYDKFISQQRTLLEKGVSI